MSGGGKDEFRFLRRAMSRFTLRVDVSTLRVRENEHWLGQTCFHARTVRKFDSRDLSFVLLLREDRQRPRLCARSAFREHNEYLFTLISKSNYRGEN